MDEKQKITTTLSEKAPLPVGLYPHAKKVGPFLFLSGVGPRQPSTNAIPATFEGQCHSVFENVKIILQESGAKWTDLVDVTVYLTNMKRDFKIYNELWAQYFSENPPCRTTVEINALPTPIDIELKCLAVVNSGKGME